MKGILSFFLVLFLMPLGHGMMILMEHYLPPTPLHFAAFAMGFVGLLLAVRGVFAEGDTRQTIFGLIGALLFWTGWVEFLLLYYAQRFGAHPELAHGVVSTTTTYVEGVSSTVMHINGKLVHDLREPWVKDLVLTRPEYLIMPSSFGFWAMFMLIYVFSIRSGCDFLNWIQKHLFSRNKNKMVFRPMTRHVSIVTFMEFNLIMWSCYLLLMFCCHGDCDLDARRNSGTNEHFQRNLGGSASSHRRDGAHPAGVCGPFCGSGHQLVEKTQLTSYFLILIFLFSSSATRLVLARVLHFFTPYP